jgi:hypothetical protein
METSKLNDKHEFETAWEPGHPEGAEADIVRQEFPHEGFYLSRSQTDSSVS